MTRKDIEKRCLEEMQQTIPDSEALWQRIEEQLPSPSDKQTAPIHMTTFRRILAGAACLLLAVAGIQVFAQMKHMPHENVTESTNSMIHMEAEDEPADEDAEFKSDEAEQPVTNETLLHYNDLRLPQSHPAGNLNAVGTQGVYFSEADVLAKTECFVDAQVIAVTASAQSGKVTYQMQIHEVYGTNALQKAQTLTFSSETAYLLQNNHLYFLPLTCEEGTWQLAYACAPQIELTLDGAAVHHNGWHTLMDDASKPLVCEQFGVDDYFYDRMYLSQGSALAALLEEWENAKNA